MDRVSNSISLDSVPQYHFRPSNYAMTLNFPIIDDAGMQ
ncbi:hypothetical protein ERAN111884_07665 [Erysipelothrix anatis]